MTDSTRVTTDEAERIVEAVRALGPQIQAPVRLMKEKEPLE